MAVGDDSLHSGFDEEIAAESEQRIVGIREGLVAGNGVDHGGENELALDGQPGADASDGDAAGDRELIISWTGVWVQIRM